MRDARLMQLRSEGNEFGSRDAVNRFYKFTNHTSIRNRPT